MSYIESKRSGDEMKHDESGMQTAWSKICTSYIILDSSMVEHSAVNRRVVGSSPTRGVLLYADMAQLAEQLICNQQVNGSSPFIGFFFINMNSTGF